MVREYDSECIALGFILANEGQRNTEGWSGQLIRDLLSLGSWSSELYVDDHDLIYQTIILGEELDELELQSTCFINRGQFI